MLRGLLCYFALLSSSQLSALTGPELCLQLNGHQPSFSSAQLLSDYSVHAGYSYKFNNPFFIHTGVSWILDNSVAFSGRTRLAVSKATPLTLNFKPGIILQEQATALYYKLSYRGALLPNQTHISSKSYSLGCGLGIKTMINPSVFLSVELQLDSHLLGSWGAAVRSFDRGTVNSTACLSLGLGVQGYKGRWG